ncbi:hypothetical protein Tco_0755057 [Tanacetum coccineum]
MYNKKNVDYVVLPWEDFMYQADNKEISSARKEHMPYPRFTKFIISHFISKDKTISMRNMINLHTIRDDSLLGTLKFVSKTQDYQQYGAMIPDDMINQDVKDSKAYKTYYDFAIGKATPKKERKFKKVASPSRKLSPVLEEEPAENLSELRNLPRSLLLCQQQVLQSETLLVKEALKKSKKDSYMLHASGSGDGVGSQPKVPNKQEDKTSGTNEGTGTKPGVPSVPKYLSESENESWRDSGDDDDDNDDDSNEVTKDDDDDDDVEKYVCTPDRFEFNDNKEEYDELYKDVDMKSLDAEREKERKGDVEMTDADKNKTEGSMQSSSVSSDFASKFLNLDNVPLADNKVAYMMNVKVCQEESSTLAPPLLIMHVTAIPKTSTIAAMTILHPYLDSTKECLPWNSSPVIVDEHSAAQADKEKYIDIIEKSVKEIIKDEVKSQLPHILPKEISDFATPAAASLTKFELKKIMLDKLEKSKSYRAAEQHRDLYDALVKSYQVDKDLFDSYGKVYSLKRGHEDKDKDEDPPAGSDQGLKKRNTSKDVEPPKGSKSKENKSNSSKGSKSQSKSSGKSAQVEDPVFETVDSEMP